MMMVMMMIYIPLPRAPPRGRQQKTFVFDTLRTSRVVVPSMFGHRQEGHPVAPAMDWEHAAWRRRVRHNMDELPQGHVPPYCQRQ